MTFRTTDRAMPNPFLVPKILQPYADRQSEIQLDGRTVRAVLSQLGRQHPKLYECICDERGEVRQHINVFVNNDFICKRTGLDRPLESNDVVSIFQAVSGG